MRIGPLGKLLLIAALALPTGCREAVSEPERGGDGSTGAQGPRDSSGSALAAGLSEAVPDPSTTASTAKASCPRFRDVAQEVGLRFVYQNGRDERALMVQSTGGGAAWLDFDRDGWIDVYFAQGGNPTAPDDPGQPRDRLFRNHRGRFVDVTDASGIREPLFGQGAAAADFDGDGFTDVYVTNVGRNTLYRNCGDGTFIEVTGEAGVGSPLWSSSAAWGDVDLDGDLDLFVCNYLDYDPYHPVSCTRDDGAPAICHPEHLAPVPNVLYLSDGNGRFRKAQPPQWSDGEGSKSLGVVIADLTNDGAPDIFVANDTTANFLYVNDGHGNFREEAVARGCALSGLGQYQASMGVAVGDYDRNGALDLYVTHFTDDSNTLYANLGDGNFEDRTRLLGLHEPVLALLAFGTVMLDFDNDGHDDLFVANGHIDDWRDRGQRWKMPAQLFTFAGQRWRECPGGGYFELPRLGRGVAVADFDRDRRPDVLVVNQLDPVALLKNESPRPQSLSLALVGRRSNRAAIGTRVVVDAGDTRLVQELCGGTSFAVSHEPRLWFGLPATSRTCRVTIRWPCGSTQTFETPTDSSWLVIEGGRPVREDDGHDG